MIGKLEAVAQQEGQVKMRLWGLQRVGGVLTLVWKELARDPHSSRRRSLTVDTC